MDIFELKFFKKGTILLILFIVVILIIPLVSAASTTTENIAKGGDNKNITIRIYQPKEGSVYYNDVTGLPDVVQGEIDAINGIRNVTITSGHDLVVCGNNSGTHLNLFCDIPRNYIEKQRYEITVFDNQGDVVSVTRNFTLIGSMPPPDYFKLFSAHGKVSDPYGNPLPNASLVFEFPDFRVWGPEIGAYRSFIRIATTDKNGLYNTEFAEEGRKSANQTANVSKEGYQSLSQNVILRNDTNEINFVLVPLNNESQSSPGFELVFGIFALLCVYLITTRTSK